MYNKDKQNFLTMGWCNRGQREMRKDFRQRYDPQIFPLALSLICQFDSFFFFFFLAIPFRRGKRKKSGRRQEEAFQDKAKRLVQAMILRRRVWT